MKKILFLFIAMTGIALTASAQTTVKKISPDTTIDAGTVYISFPGMQEGLKSFQASVKKVSGTVAGTIILQGTIDGDNWETVKGSDTMTLTNVASQNHTWLSPSTAYAGYRLQFKGSGTQRSIGTASYLRRKEYY